MIDFAPSVEAASGRLRDDNCRPRFHLKPVYMEAESAAAAREIYRDFEYVEITVPGQPKSTVDRKVRPEDMRRWPVDYQAFKLNLQAPTAGTPLRRWTLISPAEVETLEYMKVRTVEELAGLSDSQVQNCGPGTEKLRRNAKAWLKQAKDNAGLSEMSARIDQMEGQLALTTKALEKALAQLAVRDAETAALAPGPAGVPTPVVAAQADPPPKRGRPRKPQPEHVLGDEGDED